MGNLPSNDSFMSTLGNRVMPTEFTSMLGQPLLPECQRGYNDLQEEVDREPALLRSKMVVFDYEFQ
jgi:hypothetical protein